MLWHFWIRVVLMQAGARLGDGYGPYYLVVSPVSALSREETTPARRGEHGMSGKDGIWLMDEARPKKAIILDGHVALN